MHKRFAQFILSIILPALLLVACGDGTTPASTVAPTAEAVATPQQREEPVVIDVWFHSGAGRERDALNQIFDNFNATHDDIQVRTVELPEAPYNEQVQAAAFGAGIAGGLPCLLDFDGPYVYNYVWKDILIPLDDYISPEMRNDFLPSIIAQGTFQDDRLYCLGPNDSGLAIWGNREYLEEAGVRIATVDNPWSREEFEDALARLQALPQVEYALDMKMNYGIGEFYTFAFSPILQGFGADLIDRTDYQSADGVLNGPQAVAAMEMVQGWFDKGYVNPDPEGDTAFIEGKTALSWVGHWVANIYMETWGDDLVLLPMPDFGRGPKTGMGSWVWGITTNCENPDAAWEALEFALEPDQIEIFVDANGAPPARRSVLEQSELYAPGGMLHLYIEQIEADFTVPRPITPAYPVISKAFAQAFNDIARGGDVQTQLDQAVQSIDQDIEGHEGYPLR